MIKEDIHVVELMELEPSSVAEYCEVMLTADRLHDDLLGDGPFSRRSVCDFLGIDESTLTRWLKKARVPRQAATAYVLFLALQAMQEEVRKHVAEAKKLQVIETNGKYALCKFGQGEDGAVLGQIIAENITDLGVARALAGGESVSAQVWR